MTFLDDLYYGNIKPVDNEFVKKSEYDKVLKIFCDCETELRKELDKEADDTLTRLINSHNELIVSDDRIGKFQDRFLIGRENDVRCFY